MTSEFINEFAAEQERPVRLSDVLARGVPIRWDEAVALLQEIIDTITAGGGQDAPIPAFEDVLLDEEGGVRVNTARRGERGPVAAGRALHALLATADVPMPLRLFVTQANVPETHQSLKAFSDALAYFGRPGRGELVRAVHDRYRSTAPAMSAAPTPGLPATPPPLPHNAARGDEFPTEPRRNVQQWLMPAAVVVCAVSLGAVIWFGLLGGAGGAATSVPAQAKAEAAEAIPAAKGATKSPANAKGSAQKAKPERAPAPTTRAQSQGTSGNRVSRPVGRDSSAFADSSTTEPLLRFPQTPSATVPETTKATVLPFSREYVVAPHENATTTIYSSEDVDVQPPVLIYPSLPPPVFVARNADSVVVNRMELLVSADGTVERVRLVNGPWRMPDMMLLSGAKLWKFTPAVKDGSPVRYRAIVTWTGFP